MVRHFVRLKLRLLANRLRSQSVWGTIGYIAIWLSGVILGIVAGLAVFGLGNLTDRPALVLAVAYTASFIGWAMIPASMSALDESLDPRRFELLPLTPRQLTAGLLAGGAVTPGGVGTLIGLSLSTLALFPDWRLLPVTVVAVLLQWAMCLVIARLVTSFLSNLLASRRTRELVTLIAGLFFASFAILPALLDDTDGGRGMEFEFTMESFAWVENLVWLPPGAAAGGVAAASEGRLLVALASLLYAAATVAVIGFGWSKSVKRMLVTAPTVGRRGRRRSIERALALVPSWLSLPSGPVTGVVAKEFRYLIRDNRVRSQLIGSVIPVLVIGLVSQGGLVESPYAPFFAVAIAYLIVLGILANEFGIDGGSFWAYVVSPAPLSSVAKGKNLGWGLVALPLVTLIALLLAIGSGSFAYVPAAVLAAIGVLLISAAVGNFTSIYGAYRIPEGNPFGSRNASGAAFFAVILSMMVSGALLVPLALLIVLPILNFGPVAAALGALVGIGYGVVIYRLAMRLTTRLLVERQHLLLETIDGDLG